MQDIDIVNKALGHLGIGRISTFGDETSAESSIAGREYATIRDAMLTDREWSFNKDRVLLTLDAAAPAFGYTYQYIIPGTVLMVIRCYESDGQTLIDDDTGVGAGGPANSFTESGPDRRPAWVVEHGFVRTDQSAPIYAEVLLKVDENAFPPKFVLALSKTCAAEWCMALTENRANAVTLADEAEKLVEKAAFADGKQGRNQIRTVPKFPGRRR